VPNMEKRFRILISGWYGNNNVGDETILLGMLQSLREQLPDADFLVFSDDPEHTRSNYSVESFRQWPEGLKRNPFVLLRIGFWKYLLRLAKIINQSDLFILGGGGLLQHTNFGVIPFWLSKLFLAQLLGRPTVIYAVGVSPDHRKMDSFLIQVLGNRVKLITVRDAESKRNLIRLGVKRPLIRVTADPALFIRPRPWTKDKLERVLGDLGVRAERRPLIGVALAPLWSVGRKQSGQLGFNDTIVKAIDALTGDLGTQVALLVENYKEDETLMENIFARIKNKEDVLILDRQFTVEENLAFISQLDLLISVRLHPLISASLVETPLVGIVAHPKVAAFLSQVGQEDYEILFEELNPRIICETVKQALRNREQIKRELETNVELLRQKAILNAKLVKKLLGG